MNDKKNEKSRQEKSLLIKARLIPLTIIRDKNPMIEVLLYSSSFEIGGLFC